VLVPATTALYRLAPPPFLAGYTFHFKVKQKLDEAALQGQLTPGRLQPCRRRWCSPGEYAVRGGLIDLFPMGSARALPGRPVRRRDRQHPHLRPRQPAQPRTRCRRCACCPAASSPWTTRPRARFRSRWRELLRRRPDARAASYKDIGNGIATAGIEYYLPLFFDDTATRVRLPRRRTRRRCCMATWSRPSSAFWQDTRRPLPPAQHGDPERPGAAGPTSPSLQRTAAVLRRSASAAARRSRCRRAAPRLNGQRRRRRREDSASLEAADLRGRARRRRPLLALKATSATPDRVLLLAESDGRRESLLGLPARQRRQTRRSSTAWREFLASDE
jgi:transcription-repair coupling factor (superfamily II helicase)